MITCPVCEHQQAAASECEMCGKVLAATAPRDLPVQRLADLEMTRTTTPAAGPMSAMIELEQTRLLSGPDLPSAPIPDLERSVASVGDVSVEAVGDLDNGRFVTPPDGAPAARATGITCRYCRNVQNAGMFCEKCGMRLPRVAAAPDAPTPARFDEGVEVRHACGAKTRAGMRCSECGVHVPLPAA